MSIESATLKSQLDAFWADLQIELNPALPGDKAIMETGFRLYSNEQATLRHMSTGLISGSVVNPDGESFQVHLDLSSPLLSSCTCSQDHWCAHQIALFFEACQDTSKSAYDFLNDWRTTKQKPSAIPGVMRASDLLKTTIAADDGPEAWMKRIESTAEERLAARSVQKNPYVVEHEGRHVYEHLLKQRPAKREWQPLYELYVCFGLLSFITKLFS